MLAKKVTALLVSAALVLALLAGCGGGRNQSLSQMLLNLLDGQYQNVSVEIDSDLESKLRQAISESETDEELRAALEQLLGGGIRFQRLGSGQQGDSAWTLILYPGTDPNAAARSVYLDLDKVFAALPADGQYSSGFAMVEMENGYAILVKATVDKAGTEDKPDPVTLESIAVTTQPKTTYWVGESFDPANMVITATYSNTTTKTLKDIKENGNQGVSWTPDGALTTSDTSITITYGGKTTTVSVTVEEPEVEKIEVSGYISTYTEGQSFNPSGMKVTVNYTYDAPKTIINIKTNGDQGVTWTPADGLTTEIKTVKVTYTDPDSAKGSAFIEVPVTVKTKPVILTDIVATWPSKMYYEGDTLNKSEIPVEAHYSDSIDKTLNPNEYKLTIEDPSGQTTTVTDSYPFDQKGSYTLTVSYTDNDITQTDTTTIKVEDKGYEIEGNTYKVSNANGLLAWSEAVQDDLTLNCTLTADINLAGEEWTPIGTDDNNAYNGIFDGKDYAISNLTVNQPNKNYAGLFGCLGSDGKVQNLTLENVNISGAFYVGSVVGTNFGTVSGCTASGNITGTESCIGGVVGYNHTSGIVTACYHAGGTVSGSYNFGGVVGWNNQGTVGACYWSGNVQTDYGIGYDGPDTGGDPSNNNATQVTGGVTWQMAVNAMNTALESAGSDWRYELTGELPTLKNQ